MLLSVMRDGPTVLDRDGEVPLREAPFYDVSGSVLLVNVATDTVKQVFRQGLHTHLPFLNAALGSMTRYAETVHSSMWSLALLQSKQLGSSHRSLYLLLFGVQIMSSSSLDSLSAPPRQTRRRTSTRTQRYSSFCSFLKITLNTRK